MKTDLGTREAFIYPYPLSWPQVMTFHIVATIQKVSHEMIDNLHTPHQCRINTFASALVSFHLQSVNVQGPHITHTGTDSERSMIHYHGEESYVYQTEIFLIGNFNIPLQHIYFARVSWPFIREGKSFFYTKNSAFSTIFFTKYIIFTLHSTTAPQLPKFLWIQCTAVQDTYDAFI